MSAFLGRGGLPKVLFVTHSAGFVHDVVKRKNPDSLAFAEEKLVEAARGRFEVICTQDCSQVANLKDYAAVVFYTTGELKIDADALVEWVKGGGAFVGIHCATDTLYKHAGYSEMIAGHFDGHPWHEKVTLKVEDRRHPSTAHLEPSYSLHDEIYQFKDWDRKGVRVLLSLDPSSVKIEKGKRPDRDYAVAWCKEVGRGRMFYTALGHGANTWRDARFLEHVLNGISWAAGRKEPLDEEGFEEFRRQEPKNFVLHVKGSGRVTVGDKTTAVEDAEVLRVGKTRTVSDGAVQVEGGTARVRLLPDSAVEMRDTVDGEHEDFVAWLKFKGKLEANVRGTRIARESADWSCLDISALGPKIRISLNGIFEEELESAERGRIELKGETRNIRLVPLHREW